MQISLWRQLATSTYFFERALAIFPWKLRVGNNAENVKQSTQTETGGHTSGLVMERHIYALKQSWQAGKN